MSHTKEIVCEFCGQPFQVRASIQQRFCSVKCQNEWQKTNIGEKNPRYARKKHNCDYCGKEHIVKEYKLNQKNLFCSTECRRAWFANVWSQSPEWKEESKKRAVDILARGAISQTQSLPQRMVDSALDEMGVHYVREFPCSTFCIDNFLDDYNLYIEVMGDFWHANPTKYNSLQHDKQIVAVKRDIRKSEYILNTHNRRILYLWESDITRNMELCKLLVSEYIKNDGLLANYNSFNYSIEDNRLVLHKETILPYQELTLEELQQYI